MFLHARCSCGAPCHTTISEPLFHSCRCNAQPAPRQSHPKLRHRPSTNARNGAPFPPHLSLMRGSVAPAPVASAMRMGPAGHGATCCGIACGRCACTQPGLTAMLLQQRWQQLAPGCCGINYCNTPRHCGCGGCNERRCVAFNKRDCSAHPMSALIGPTTSAAAGATTTATGGCVIIAGGGVATLAAAAPATTVRGCGACGKCGRRPCSECGCGACNKCCCGACGEGCCGAHGKCGCRSPRLV